MFGSFLLIPQLAEAPAATGYGFALTATGAGVLMLPGSLAMLGAGPLSGRLSARVSPKPPLALGGVITACGLLSLGLAPAAGDDRLADHVGRHRLRVRGDAELIVESVPAERAGEATGFNQLVRSVGSSLGSQVPAAILTGSVVSGAPTDAGYTAAFLTSAGVALAAGIVSALIPRAPRPPHLWRWRVPAASTTSGQVVDEHVRRWPRRGDANRHAQRTFVLPARRPAQSLDQRRMC